MSKKVKVTICHVIPVYKQDDNEQVFQIKMKTEGVEDALGTTKGKHYYIKVTKPKVEEGDQVVIDLDNYDVVTEEFKPEGEDKIILLSYLVGKGRKVEA